MEQEQPHPATQQADCVVVDLELQVVGAGNNDAGHGSDDNYDVVGVKARPATGGGGQDHHHVVDVDRLLLAAAAAAAGTTSPKADHAVVEPKDDDSDDDGGAGKNRCVVCTEPMSSVAFGRCGHRVVCSKCMVRMRFFQKNKCCCVCRTHCPKVLVAKVEGVSDITSVTTLLPKLPRFVFRDGRVGNYWYHGYTAAYFEEEQEYRAVRTECEGIIPAFYDPLPCFLAYFGFFLAVGALVGVGIASGAKHLSSQMTAYVLGIFGALLFATVIWTVQKCRPYDPDVLENARLDKLYGKQSCMW